MMFNSFVFGIEFVFKVINVNEINQTKNKKFKACFIHVRVVLIVWCAVFHVTDQLGNKVTDESLILYIQQVLLYKSF